jgi:hypothetical protein
MCRESGEPLRRKATGNFAVRLLLLPDRIPLTNRAGQAHIWRTRRRRETTLPGVLEVLSLIDQTNGHRLIQPDEAEEETSSELTGKLLLYPLVEDGGAEAPDLADLQGANLPHAVLASGASWDVYA